MHHTVAGTTPFAAPVKQVSGLVYATIRGVTRVVGASLDTALARLEPLLGDTAPGPGPGRLAVVAALNGVVGDLLERSGNALAQPMELHRRVPSKTTGKVVVLIHGSSMNDLQWTRNGHDHGAALERDLGFSAVYARYNSGLHVSTNGHRLAEALEALIDAWPVPVETLVLLGHSMGGLVARSACHAAEVAGMRWRRHLTSLVSLGSPHQGAALELAGSWAHAALEISRFSEPLADLAKLRSEGVTDLRFGYVLDAHWRDRDRFQTGPDERDALPLPVGVSCFAVAASLSKTSGKKPRGDGLVSVASALGRSPSPRLQLDFPASHQHVVYGASHLDLLDHGSVFEAVRNWLGPGAKQA